MASQWKRFSSLFSSRGVLCILLSTIISNGLTEEIIVLRSDQDIFGTNDIGDHGSCYSWCTANSNDATVYIDVASKHSCKCQCDFDHPTFLIQYKKCYETKDLKRPFNGTKGLFLFKDTADLHWSGSIDTNLAVDTGKPKCQVMISCQQINNVKFLFGNSWMSTDISEWDIHTTNNHVSWKTALPHLKGKIIKIQLKGQCAGGCTSIFIKAKGRYIFPPTSVSQYTSNVNTLLASTPTTTPTPTPSLISTPAVPTTSVHVGCSISTLCSISPSARVPYPTTEATITSTSKPKDRGGKEKQSSETGAVVGSVIGFVVIVAVIIVLVILCRKCREKPRTKDHGEDKSAKDSKSNPTYGRNHGETITMSQHSKPTRNAEDNELEYDYAAIDGDPRSHGNQATNETAPQVYQSLDPARDSVYTPLNREPGAPPDPTYAYNKIERPLYDPSRKGTADPLYNVLDRSNGNNHDYMEPGVHIDKGHNKRPTSKQDPQNNEPVYNVLEEPNQGGSKEADEEDEPEYNVVEDPDNAYDYACVEGNIRHPSSCDNVGYESTLGIKPPQSDPDYAVLEGPSSEPSYQPLQIKAQDDKVYQPLDRASRNLEQPVYHVLEDKRNHSDA